MPRPIPTEFSYMNNGLSEGPSIGPRSNLATFISCDLVDFSCQYHDEIIIFKNGVHEKGPLR